MWANADSLMLLWFAATSVLTIHFVFGDPRFDHRWLIVGAVAPVLADVVGGWTSMVSSVSAGVVVLVAVMLATIERATPVLTQLRREFRSLISRVMVTPQRPAVRSRAGLEASRSKIRSRTRVT